MLDKKNKGIGFMLGFFIFTVMAFLSAALFMYLWQYNLRIYIISDARESTSSMIPLVLFSKTYEEDETYISKFNKAKIIDESENEINKKLKESLEKEKEDFIREQKELIEIYIIEYCFKIETDTFEFTDFEDKKEWVLHVLPTFPMQIASREYKCSENIFYEKSYQIPIVFDGEKFTETFEFKVHELRKDLKKEIEKEGIAE